MHFSNHFCNTFDQHSLDGVRRGISDPVFAIIFQTNTGRQILCNNKRGFLNRIKTFFTISHSRHCVDTDLHQFINRSPFAVGSEYRKSKLKEILNSFGITDSVMKLQVKALSSKIKAQCATCFNFAQNVAGDLFHFFERIFVLPA